MFGATKRMYLAFGVNILQIIFVMETELIDLLAGFVEVQNAEARKGGVHHRY